MKILDLKPDDIVWIHNSEKGCYRPFKLLTHLDNDMSRFVPAGEEVETYPDNAILIKSVEYRSEINEDGEEKFGTIPVKRSWKDRRDQVFEGLFPKFKETIHDLVDQLMEEE